MKKKQIWKTCGSKNRYRDEHTANYYRKVYENMRGTKLDYYWCPYCDGFHLTSTGLDPRYYSFDEIDNTNAAVS